MKRYLLFLILLVSSVTLWFATAPMRAAQNAAWNMIADDDWKSAEELRRLAEARRLAAQADWTARARGLRAC